MQIKNLPFIAISETVKGTLHVYYFVKEIYFESRTYIGLCLHGNDVILGAVDPG